MALLDRARKPARSCCCCAVLVVALAAAVLEQVYVSTRVESGQDTLENLGGLLSVKNPRIISGHAGTFVAALWGTVLTSGRKAASALMGWDRSCNYAVDPCTHLYGCDALDSRTAVQPSTASQAICHCLSTELTCLCSTNCLMNVGSRWPKSLCKA